MWIFTMWLQVTDICVTVGVTRDKAASQGSCHVCGCKEANFTAKNGPRRYRHRHQCLQYSLRNKHGQCIGQQGGDGYYIQDKNIIIESRYQDPRN